MGKIFLVLFGFLATLSSIKIHCDDNERNTPLLHSNTIETNDSTLRILTYGMVLRYDDELSRRAVEKKYGFERYVVAGCVVTNELLDSVKIHNDAIRVILTKKHGANWEKEMEKEIMALHNEEKKAISLLEKEKYVAEKRKEAKEKGYILDYKMDYPVEGVFKFIIYQDRYDTLEWQREIYFRVTVDLKRNKVILESDTVEITPIRMQNW